MGSVVRISRIPQPPMDDSRSLTNLFLEDPLMPSLALLGVAIVLAIVARQQNRPRLMAGSAIALVLAVGVWVLATAVTTDRETVMQHTRELVLATAPLDTNTLNTFIDPNATLRGPDGTVWLEHESFRLALALAIKRWAVKSQAVRGLQAGVDDRGNAVTRFEARTTFEQGTGLPVRTVWQLQWRQDPEGNWRVIDIQWLEFQDREPSEGMWR